MMSTPEPRRRRAPRGSGDLLRGEILDSASDLMLSHGDAGAVSIRSVARRVGVTPPSIYLHFADKDALLDAVCARYFEQLGDEMQQAATEQTCTLDVLRAQGLALVRFALRVPEPFRAATMGPSRPGNAVDAAMDLAAFRPMRATVRQLMQEGIYSVSDPTAVTFEVCAAAHGVANLLIAKPYLAVGDPDAFADRVITAICMGQLVLGLVASDAEREQLANWLVRRQKGRS